MAKKTGLGRGLDALLPTVERPAGEKINEIPVDQILPNPRQPRTHVDPEELEELSASIREHGVIQPLILTPGDGPEQYVLIAGERRLLAARQAGLKRVPAIVRQASDQQRLELALIENVQRADLSPLEAAQAYRQLNEDFSLSHEKIAERVGKSRASITNTMRLLNLCAQAQDALASGLISEGHGRTLLSLDSTEAQEKALRIIQDQELSVRQAETLARAATSAGSEILSLSPIVLKALADRQITTEHATKLLALENHQAQEAVLQTVLSKGLDASQTEALLRKLKDGKRVERKAPVKAPEITDLEERLRFSVGFPVSIRHGRKGGVITFEYFSDEDLNTIIDRILGED